MLNHISIMGRMTADPELRRTGSGTAVVNFTLAVERDFKDADGNHGVDFIPCVAWRGTGEFAAKYFAKGRAAVVDGRLEQRSWTDKDGNKRTSYEVNASSIYFADSKRSDLSTDVSVAAAQPSAYNAPMPHEVPDDYAMLTDDDDGQLPF